MVEWQTNFSKIEKDEKFGSLDSLDKIDDSGIMNIQTFFDDLDSVENLRDFGQTVSLIGKITKFKEIALKQGKPKPMGEAWV